MVVTDFIVDNVGIDEKTYEINEFILLKQDEKNIKKTRVCFKTQENWHSDYTLFFYALLIAIPKVHITISYRKQGPEETESEFNRYKDNIRYLNCYMFNYYFNTEDNFDNSYVEICKGEIEKIKNTFNIIVEYNFKEQEKFNIDRWLVAYNQYLRAYKSLSVEMSIQNLITVLEALLVKGDGELNFRVALYTSFVVEANIEKRKEIFSLVKYMYDIRSKSVHGEILSKYKKLKNFDYDKYYRFKEIVSEVLMKTYGKKEDDIFNALESMIYCSEKFEYY